MGNGHPVVGTELKLVHRIVSYRGKYRVERAPASALLFHGKRKRGGKDGAEPRRQSATGNLKSCANTRAVGGLDERCGGYMAERRLLGRLVGRGVKVYPEKGYARRNYVIPSNS